ncbi:ABC transporter permease [Candidatus Albibeggiatoa sp. nov. BB20]|uniref:ABC transporter permease n=1 Tax=Candidatus Albibeggiatoa sp. nov. BB20 TaxID=3162723 RepID=UPI0033655C70
MIDQNSKLSQFFSHLWFKFKKTLKNPRLYIGLLGIISFGIAYYLFTEVWRLPRFEKLPGPKAVLTEWFSSDPMWGISIYTEEYYQHIWASLRRVGIALLIATGLGVPLGLFMGWSKTFKDYTFPVLEILRPIPVLAWVPLAILMFSDTETPVIFLATLASFYVTVLNTMLGVESINPNYLRAAACLGSKRHHLFLHIILPGALPYIFTGLQISVGVSWFSLVAAEMVSGQYGLGYLILNSYTSVTYETIVIVMLTLGLVGYASSALVRLIGQQLMQWQARALAMENRP